MPMLECSINYSFYSILKELKNGTAINNITQHEHKFGFSAGIGLSAFMMELLASYNYYNSNQFVSIDFKIRLPLYINI